MGPSLFECFQSETQDALMLQGSLCEAGLDFCTLCLQDQTDDDLTEEERQLQITDRLCAIRDRLRSYTGFEETRAGLTDRGWQLWADQPLLALAKAYQVYRVILRFLQSDPSSRDEKMRAMRERYEVYQKGPRAFTRLVEETFGLGAWV